MSLGYKVRRWIASGTRLELLIRLKVSPDGMADTVIEDHCSKKRITPHGKEPTKFEIEGATSDGS